MFPIMGGATVYAGNSEQKESVMMFTKNLKTGEEFTEDIMVSKDENVLNALFGYWSCSCYF